jgi:hypothetical protein
MQTWTRGSSGVINLVRAGLVLISVILISVGVNWVVGFQERERFTFPLQSTGS